MKRMSQDKGFTLLELIVALSIALIVAAATAPQIMQKMNERLVDRTVAEIYTIQEAAHTFFIDNSNFPGGANCANAIAELQTEDLLVALDQESPWATNYATSCSGSRFVIEVDVPEPNAARVVNSLVDAEVIGGGGRARSSIPAPNAIAGLGGDFLSRVDTGDPQDRTMESDILMDNNNIVNAGDVGTNTVTAAGTVQGGSVETTGGNVVTNGGDMLTGGGNLDTGGGDAALGSGNIDQLGEVEFVNGVRVVSGGADILRFIANEVQTSGDLSVEGEINVLGDVNSQGVMNAEDFVTANGKQLQRSVQDITIVNNGATVDKPACLSGMSPEIWLAPSSVLSEVSSSAPPIAGIQTAVSSETGTNWTVEIVVTTDKGNVTPEVDEILAITKCI